MEGLGVPGIAQAAGNVGDIARWRSVSQANAVTSLFTAATLGLASGSAVLISQFWGKKDMASIKRLFPIVTLLCLLVSLVFVAIALLIPDQVLGLVLSSDDITRPRALARAYFSGGVLHSIRDCLRADRHAAQRGNRAGHAVYHATSAAVHQSVLITCLSMGRLLPAKASMARRWLRRSRAW